jgi:hypothetical protein
MKEYVEESYNEMKRCDHLIYVSLKYTRTTDIIRSIIERLHNTYETLLTGYLQEYKEKNKVDVPTAPGMIAEFYKQLYPNDAALAKYLDFYLLCRRILRANYDKQQEFRRHVTMTVHLEDGDLPLTIDVVTEYYHNARMFLAHMRQYITYEEESQ